MSILKHPWLSPEEQAIMDAATSVASDYGIIAVTSETLDTLVPLSTVAISLRDFIEITRLTNVGAQYGIGELNLVRLNEDQRDDLANAGIVFRACHADPTGEKWGNIMRDLAQMDAGQHDHQCNPAANARQAVQFIADGSWGTTLADAQALKAAAPRGDGA